MVVVSDVASLRMVDDVHMVLPEFTSLEIRVR